MEKLIQFIDECRPINIERYKTEIFNKQILQKIIDTYFEEECLKFAEKYYHLVESEILSTIDNYMIDLAIVVEDYFKDYLQYYIMRQNPSDQNSIRVKVSSMREEIVKFFSDIENKQNQNFYKIIKKKIGYFFNRYLPNLLGLRTEEEKLKLEIYDLYSNDYWFNGDQINEFFNIILKKLPAFVEILGLKYQTNQYCGKSNDLYNQLDDLHKKIKN